MASPSIVYHMDGRLQRLSERQKCFENVRLASCQRSRSDVVRCQRVGQVPLIEDHVPGRQGISPSEGMAADGREGCAICPRADAEERWTVCADNVLCRGQVRKRHPDRLTSLAMILRRDRRRDWELARRDRRAELWGSLTAAWTWRWSGCAAA